MQCDVRQMHPDDVPHVWKKVKKHLSSADITRDEGEWFLHIKGWNWRFDSHGRGFIFNEDGTVDASRASVFIDYYPPNGGNVRFDTSVYAGGGYIYASTFGVINPIIVQEYGEALAKYGHGGKNRLSYYEGGHNPVISNQGRSGSDFFSGAILFMVGLAVSLIFLKLLGV